MTTPTKNEIRDKAIELFEKSNGHLPSINPEDSELRENGLWFEARDQLMRSEQTVDLSQLEEIAGSLGYELTKVKKQHSKPLEDFNNFPISKIMREGCIIVGGRGSGKSNLAKLLVQASIACGIGVKVIDSSLAWKAFPLPKIKVRKGRIDCVPNAIYDVSRLSVIEMREFVTAMITEDTKRAIELTDLGLKVPLLYVLEEVQNLVFPNTLRMLKYQEVSRYVTQGRNFNLGFIGLTQRLSSIDANLAEISGVKFWHKLEGQNNLRKARAWLNKYTVWNLKNLEIGQCYIQHSGKVKLVRFPLFEAKKVIV